MDFTVDDLIMMIGRKQIEIEMLRAHNKQLIVDLRRAQANTNEDEDRDRSS